MSEETGPLKHRHEGHDVEHGAPSQERVTRVLQFLLATTIILSLALLVFTFVVGA